jgi:hypothetical protein
MSGEDSKSNSITKLTSSNYPTWKGEMKAYLCVKGLWLLVNGSETCPDSLAMQVFVPLTPPILFALYNLMQMLFKEQSHS